LFPFDGGVAAGFLALLGLAVFELATELLARPALLGDDFAFFASCDAADLEADCEKESSSATNDKEGVLTKSKESSPLSFSDPAPAAIFIIILPLNSNKS
jgi:hypothetical protein